MLKILLYFNLCQRLFFIRLNMDLGDVIYNQPLNESVFNRIESVQYKAALASTGVIQELS